MNVSSVKRFARVILRVEHTSHARLVIKLPSDTELVTWRPFSLNAQIDGRALFNGSIRGRPQPPPLHFFRFSLSLFQLANELYDDAEHVFLV